jgi:hypothetical protein
MNNEAREVAKRLTAAQRLLVMASDPDDISGQDGCGVQIRKAEYKTARSLSAMGLGSHTHGSPFGDMYWNHSFGLEVRAILQAEGRRMTPETTPTLTPGGRFFERKDG